MSFLLGAEAAHSCPVKTQILFDKTMRADSSAGRRDGCAPPAPSRDALAVGAWISRAHPSDLANLAQSRDPGDADSAMAAGVPLVLWAPLPPDASGHRGGRPFLLVGSETGGYRPVVLGSGARGGGRRTSDGALAASEAELMRASHSHRMLAACGRATAEGDCGVVRADPVRPPEVVWADLGESPDGRAEGGAPSPLERYD